MENYQGLKCCWKARITVCIDGTDQENSCYPYRTTLAVEHMVIIMMMSLHKFSLLTVLHVAHADIDI